MSAIPLSSKRPSKSSPKTDIAKEATKFVGESSEDQLVRLSVDIPPALRKGLRHLAADRDVNQRVLVIEALQAQFPELRNV